MKPIPADIVNQTGKEIGHLSPEQGEQLLDRMAQEQPDLLGYLSAVGDESFTESEQSVFLYLGMVLWRIMSQGNPVLQTVGGEAIERAEENNFKMIEYLEQEPESDFTHTVRLMMQEYNQMEVLRYVLQMLMEEPDVQEVFRDEYKGLAMIYLKTLIDCLDQ